MAFLTFDADMLPFQQVARLFMIEGLGVELRNREIESVVVGVALGTSLAGAGLETVGEVQAFVGREATCDLRVTVQAPEGSLRARQFMAVDTVCGAFKIFVRSSQRTW